MRTCWCWMAVCIVIVAFGQERNNSKRMDSATPLTCKLTTSELQERKRTIIAEMKKLARERTETDNGFRYKFDGTDLNIDLLTGFIKTERLCCSFFDFNLTVAAEAEGFIWLTLSGPSGTKEFIEREIGF